MNCNPCSSLSEDNPSANVQRHDIYKNYGAITDNEAGSDGFGYVEFTGKDGRTCPTCDGTGRIAKDKEDELVALIPYSDRRLKPSRTKCYVSLAVVVCLFGCALALFFLLPRAVSIEQDKILHRNVSIDSNTSSTTITLLVRFNVTNWNFVGVDISDIVIEAFVDMTLVGTSKLPKSRDFRVGARYSNFPVTMKIVIMCNARNNMQYVKKMCTSPERPVHDVLIVLQTTQNISYLLHSEQGSLKTYNYLDCDPNKHWWEPVGGS